MATIRITKISEKEYIQVVTYETNRYGNRRIKVLKSFGPNTTLNMIEAKIFKANYDILEKISKDPQVEKAEGLVKIEKVTSAIAGGILGYKVLEYLFGNKKK
jgi:hypothetical protein